MTHRAKAEAAACPPHAPSILSLCLCFGFSFFGWFGSFLVDAMQYASWGSVSFVSVESACRHYGVSMTSPMTSLTSLGVMFRNLEESRSRSLHVRQKKYPRSSLRFNPGYAPTGAWTHPVLLRLLAAVWPCGNVQVMCLSLIHISEPTRRS